MSNTLGSRATAAGFVVMLLAANAGISFGELGMILGQVEILIGASFVAVGLRMGDDPTTPTVPAAFARVGALITTFLHRYLAVVGLVMSSSAVTAVAGVDTRPVLCFSMLVLFLLGLCFVHVHVLEECW